MPNRSGQLSQAMSATRTGTVTTADGTVISFDLSGAGPAVILVQGALMNRSDPVMTGIAARRFTGGLSEFDVEANTVRRMITELDRRFPGLGHQIDEGMAVAIDGEIFQYAYQAQLNPDSEVVLIPKIGGG